MVVETAMTMVVVVMSVVVAVVGIVPARVNQSACAAVPKDAPLCLARDSQDTSTRTNLVVYGG